MGRSLKFRAWDIENKFMHRWYVIIKDKDILTDIFTTDFYETMQCTGLKDKNGKEIYEGDICKHKNGIGKVWYRSNLTSFVVDGELGNYAIDRDCEVIGNRFENPELLK